MTYYRRSSTELRDELAALAAGVAVGAAATYLARLWLRREPVGDAEDEERSPPALDEGGPRP